MDEGTTQLAVLDTEKVLQENHQRIMQRDGSKVFPINPALRKKLEHLKESKLGDMRTQMDFIKAEKYEQFLKNNAGRIKELEEFAERENRKLRTRVMHIMKAKRKDEREIKERTQKQEGAYKKAAREFFAVADKVMSREPDHLKEAMNYNFPLQKFRKSLDVEDNEYTDDEKIIVNKYNEIEQSKKDAEAYKITFDKERFKKEVLDKEFKERFGKPFEEAKNRINALETQFSESLLFGDMDVVKNVYYNLRKAETFIEQLRTITLK